MNMYYDIVSMNIFLFLRYRFTFINQYSYCSNIFHSFIRFYRFSIDFKRLLFIFKGKKIVRIIDILLSDKCGSK